jgi:hypothetical protein
MSQLICTIRPDFELRMSERGQLLLAGGPFPTQVLGVEQLQFAGAVLGVALEGEVFLPGGVELRWNRHA